MTVLYLLLLALASVCFVSNAFGRSLGKTSGQGDLASLGLFFGVLVPLIETARSLS